MAQISYTESHKYESKGTEYEQYYQTQAWQKFLWSREQQIILKILDKYFAGADVHLLDFACGTGRIAGLLESHVKTSTGVDVSGSMLAVAREKLKHTQIIEADITAENILKPRKFNLITAFRFFLNAEPELRRAAIRALVDLLDDDGYLVFNNHQNVGSPWTKLLYRRHRRKNPEGVFNVMSIQEMQELVRQAGLEIVEIFPVGFFHPPKVPVSYGLNRAIDTVASMLTCLNRFCESPIAVCRRRQYSGVYSVPLRKGPMELIGSCARKTGESSLLAIEAAKASRGLEIGKDSGLFRVPKVLNFDAEAGLLDFERFEGLVTLLHLALLRDGRLAGLLEKAGKALAVIHEKLTLPETMKYELPPQWSGPSEQNVFIHGDFACINVCYHETSDELVIVDWSAAPLVGRTPTFGSRYFDILMFVSSLFHGAPCRRVLTWDAPSMSRAFLRGYRKAAPQVKLSGIKDQARLICRLQRKNLWQLARQKQPLLAVGYVCCQMLQHARLCLFLREYEF